MKKVILLLLLAFGAFLAKPVFADCLATNDQVQPAWDAKAEAVSAKGVGDFVTAALKFQEAAKLHPQEAYAASYLMNAVGCLLSTELDAKGRYSWDAEKGTKNAQVAYGLLDQVQDLLDKAKDAKCKYSTGVIGQTQAWHDAQLKWLMSQVPRSTK